MELSESTNLLSVQKLLQKSWQVFTRNTVQILTISFGSSCLLFILSFLFLQNSSAPYASVIRIIIGILSFVIGIMRTMAIILNVQADIEEKSASLYEIFKKIRPNLYPAILNSFIVGFFTALLTLLLVIPGVIYGMYWFFALYATTLRDKFYKGARDYSKDLVSGRWWKVFWRILALGVIVAIFSVLLRMLLGVFTLSDLEHFWKIQKEPTTFVGSFLSEVLSGIISSFFVITWTILFLNLENSKKTPSFPLEQ